MEEETKRNVFLLISLVVIGLIVFYLVYIYSNSNEEGDNANHGGIEVYEEVFGKFFGTILYYTAGPVSKTSLDKTNEKSAIIVQIAFWLLIFVTFGDIIANFSSFSKPVSWIAAFLIGIIAANTGMCVILLSSLNTVFSVLGAVSVYASLFAALLAFFAVNTYIIPGLKMWVIKRKATIELMKKDISKKKGLETFTAGVEALIKAGKEIEKAGKEDKSNVEGNPSSPGVSYRT
ncbi:MAG: hypothetical protein QW273_02510 [Candidatus Pacearchaeota archaeon]